MDDSLERDQLNLWQKLNSLYGDEKVDQRPEEPETGDGPDNIAETGSGELADGEKHTSPGNLGSESLDEVDMVQHPAESSTVNEVCADCRYDCPQPPGQFIIARCRLAAQSRPHHHDQTPNQVAASQGSMGIEKINETCRRCSRSCKQRTNKLNRMLCLGFLPLEE